MSGLIPTAVIFTIILFASPAISGKYLVQAETNKNNLDDAFALHRMGPNPNPYQVTYEDGTKSPLIRLRIRGEETSPSHQVYEETLDGFTVKPTVEGKYVYLEVDDKTGDYIETKFVAGVDDPYSADIHANAAERREKFLKATITTKHHSSSRNIFNRVLQGEKIKGDQEPERRRTVITTGTLKNLVIPFKFSDHTGRTLPSRSDLNILMNNVGPNALCPTGSVRDVYLQNSFNQLDLQSTVINWVTLDYTEAYCADNNSGLSNRFDDCLKNALDKARAAGVDFSDFDVDSNGVIDGMTFFHSGYAAEWGGFDEYGTSTNGRIWSHKYTLFGSWSSNGVGIYEYHINPALWDTSGSAIGRIGVVAHETGHFLGLPDLYDYGDGSGIGSWGLMANSWYEYFQLLLTIIYRF